MLSSKSRPQCVNQTYRRFVVAIQLELYEYAEQLLWISHFSFPQSGKPHIDNTIGAIVISVYVLGVLFILSLCPVARNTLQFIFCAGALYIYHENIGEI